MTLDRPCAFNPEEPEDLRTELSHHWVEAQGWWIDITADQFQPWVDEPLPPVLIAPAGRQGRYRVQGDPDVVEVEESEEVRRVVAEALVEGGREGTAQEK